MADDRDRGRERDLVLAPNEYAFISDETKGNINVYVGPHKTSLANTDRPVVFNDKSKRFDRCSLEQAIQVFSVSPEGWYLVLKNPAKDASHPRTGALNNLPELNIGRKVNNPGPVSCALWPGQMVRVLQGHHLRSNQYLVVRVYDEEAAKANYKNAVIKPQSSADDGKGSPPAGAESPSEDVWKPEDLTMGNLLVIKGTLVAFYIPPTGIEVVRDVDSYVRTAATLERLEYCILLDEDGNKRFIRGPAVVFPRPTETFVERKGMRKFRAMELNENSGIYVKVIAPYEEGGTSFKIGDELFLTGKDQMIYFPRQEHAIVKYGENEIHYAIAIPAGEARYVLDRHTGQIRLHKGPSIFLPDPRKEVIVRRVLDARTVALWFPGNREALEVNAQLKALQAQQGTAEYVVDQESKRETTTSSRARDESAAQKTFAGDDFTRSQTYTAPRTLVLNTRYDGAVSLDVWTGYAMMVVSRIGERKVIVGPHTHLMAYDETLQRMELSTGTPKSDESLHHTVYLRVLHNKVSDRIEAETRDLCQVHLHLSYRVNFEGDSGKWFNVENYVKFLTDHLRSRIRGAVKQHGIEAFYGNAAALVRDVVLGAQGEDGKRTGRLFEENGMRVYDVEVLDVTIGDEGIAQLLVNAQQEAVRQALAIAAEQRKVTLVRESESTKQQIMELSAATRLKETGVKLQEVGEGLRLTLAEARAEAESRKERQAAQVGEQEALGAIHAADLLRRKATADLNLEVTQRELDQRLRELAAEVQAVAGKAGAVSPDLVAALQAFSDRALAERVAQSMAPLAILGGESVADVLGKLLSGTSLGDVLSRKGDGGAKQLPAKK
jgi:major vault protein